MGSCQGSVPPIPRRGGGVAKTTRGDTDMGKEKPNGAPRIDTVEAARIMGLGTARMSKLLRDGRVPTAKVIDGRWSIEKAAVQELARAYSYRGTGGVQPTARSSKPSPNGNGNGHPA